MKNEVKFLIYCNGIQDMYLSNYHQGTMPQGLEARIPDSQLSSYQQNVSKELFLVTISTSFLWSLSSRSIWASDPLKLLFSGQLELKVTKLTGCFSSLLLQYHFTELIVCLCLHMFPLISLIISTFSRCSSCFTDCPFLNFANLSSPLNL